MTMDSFPEQASQSFQYADRMLAAAELMLRHDLPESAVDRAYYAIFHAAQAAISLLTPQQSKTHRGLSVLFTHHFIESGLVDHRLNKVLSEALNLRQRATYNTTAAVSHLKATEQVALAASFVSLMRHVSRNDANPRHPPQSEV